MAGRVINDDEWKAAREAYETTAAGYGALAKSLSCSKNLVARRAAKEGWSKQSQADSESVAAAAPAASESAIVTEKAALSETRTPSAAGEAAQNSAPTASVAPVAARPVGAWHIPAPPDHFDAWQREDYVRDQVTALVIAQNQAHQAEQRALSNQWRTLMRSASPDAAAVRSHKLLADSMRVRQGQEKESLLDFVRSEQNKLPAQGNVSVRISVVKMEGVAFGADNSEAAVAYRNRVRTTLAAVRGILRERLGIDKTPDLAIEEALKRLKFDGAGDVIDGITDVVPRMVDASQ